MWKLRAILRSRQKAMVWNFPMSAPYRNNKIEEGRLRENYGVLLPTAVVTVDSAEGTPLNLRAFLDQGSQASFITENAVQLLGL